MNIVRSFLATALAVDSSELLTVAHKRLNDSPFTKEMVLDLDDLMSADPKIINELWKFSLALDVPHQLLCDSYWLQQKTNILFDHPKLVVRP